MKREKITILETGIDVKPFLEELKKQEHLWKMVSQMKNIGGNKNPHGLLPLVLGVETKNTNINDSNIEKKTPAYYKFPYLLNWLREKGCEKFNRAGFFKLEPYPYGKVLPHVEKGLYYQNKDRYHLSLSSVYEYTVEDEVKIIEPGTFFWFENKLEHSSVNLTEEERISFVFDIDFKYSPVRKIA